jgi:DNA-3-methyladenine glycosylase
MRLPAASSNPSRCGHTDILLLQLQSAILHLARMEFTPLPRSFYAPSAEVVAPRLLGHWLLCQTPDGFCGGPIVEVEAYLVGDPASHGFAGVTARNRVMYGPPGFAYVYFIYGNHYCANAVCGAAGEAEAVLIRAVEARFGVELLSAKRAGRSGIELTNGPGKLCEALGIGRKMDGADLCDPTSPLLLARNPNVSRFRHSRGPVVTSPRIGLTKAAELPLRFHLQGSPFVSRRSNPALGPAGHLH